MVNQDVSDETNTTVLITCLIISTVFVLLRAGARWFKNRQLPFSPEDIAIYIALSSFAIMASLYLSIIPILARAYAVQAGLAMPWATMLDDLAALLKEFFAVQIFFWLTLWAVKFSLLLMFQRLTTGLPKYERIWWAVVIFTALTFLGCLVSHFMSCHSMHAWFTAGLCSTPQDAVSKAASLWYALAVDLITDIMIMAVPIQILYNLHITTTQKLSVGVVFIVGIITMIVAVVRVVSLDSGTSNGQVNTSWLIMWAAIEGMVAIIVGCLPSFAIFIRGRVSASRVSAGYPYPSNLNSHSQSQTQSRSRKANGLSSPKLTLSSHLSSFASRSRTKAKARIESFSLDDMESGMEHTRTANPRSHAEMEEEKGHEDSATGSGSEARSQSRNQSRGSESDLVIPPSPTYPPASPTFPPNRAYHGATDSVGAGEYLPSARNSAAEPISEFGSAGAGKGVKGMLPTRMKGGDGALAGLGGITVTQKWSQKWQYEEGSSTGAHPGDKVAGKSMF